MPEASLLLNLALALIAATIGGFVAVRLGQSAILGYIVVGVLLSPYTPGPIGDPQTVAELADIGLIFLLFAVGLELSVRDLVRAGRVAAVGGTLQVLVMLGLGYGVALAAGFGQLEALFFGAFVSQSSSIVAAKILSERDEIDTEHGRVAFGWATLQDLSTIVLVVLLTAVSTGGDLGSEFLLATGKALLFIAVLLPVGLRVLPWAFEHIAMLRNREVFVISVAAFALGTAILAESFGLSLALGAFVAGLLISESEISHQVLGELVPLRDVFAGLFFISVGMLVDPFYVLAAWPLVLVAIGLMVVVKGALIAGFSRLFGLPGRTALLVGAVLAQSGEFSFLLARLGVDLGVVGAQMFSLMLSSAAVSIAIAPTLNRLMPHAIRALERRIGGSAGDEAAAAGAAASAPRYNVVIAGYGRVGRVIGEALERRGFSYQVLEIDPRICRVLRERGIDVIQGAAENPHNLRRAGLDRARVLVVALADPIALRQVVHHARRENSRLLIVARARSTADREFLQREGVSEIVSAEVELAIEMARFTLARLGVSAAETGAIVAGLRRRGTGSGASDGAVSGASLPGG
jgi:CPA2 family monovalent cation:H+ antiporter-2